MTPTFTDELQGIAQRHLGKILAGLGGTMGSAILAGVSWYVIESKRIDTLVTQTAATLDAHMSQEQRNYESVMDVMDHVQRTTMTMASDVAVLRYRLDAGAIPASARVNNFAQGVDMQHGGE